MTTASTEPMTIPFGEADPPHIVDDLPFDQYAALPRVNSSLLKAVHTSLAHAKAVWDGKRDIESRSIDIGLVCHAATEPGGLRAFERFEGDLRSKDAKARWAAIEAEGRTPVRAADYDAGVECGIALVRNPVVRRLVRNPNLPGRCERTITWTDDATGLPCKARCDWLSDDGRVILDIKTTTDAGEHAFRGKVAALMYHVQAAHYCAGVKAAMGTDPVYVWAVVETTYPHAVAVYQLNKDQLEPSRKMRDRLMSRWKWAVQSDQFPGYVSGWPPPEISVPAWAIAEGEEVSNG